MHILRIFLLMILGLPVIGQTPNPEKLDLPGDNLNLYAVLKLFQESETLEAFERKLNDDSNQVNNLDLDGDDQIDYIRVIDYPEDGLHNITLKVALNKDEDQDVAVFVVKKLGDGQVEIQLIGDEDLYGKDFIIEPNLADGNTNQTETPNPGYTGTVTLDNGQAVKVETVTTYQIASWPVIRYFYVPTYIVWRSPWTWAHYPTYWRPWRPHYWHYYYGYHFHWQYHYYSHYRRWPAYRVPGWRDRYYGSSYRSRSPVYQTRIRQGAYRNTYSRPQMAFRGAAVFKRDNPKAPFVNNKLPAFDKSGRPVVVRPAITNPGTTRPVVSKPGTRPVTKPGVTRPVTKPVTRPATRPVTNPGGTRPVTNPGGTRPVTNPGITRPVTKPVTNPGVTRPVNKPVTRPSATRPPSTTQPVKKTATRPAPAKRATGPATTAQK